MQELVERRLQVVGPLRGIDRHPGVTKPPGDDAVAMPETDGIS